MPHDSRAASHRELDIAEPWSRRVNQQKKKFPGRRKSDSTTGQQRHYPEILSLSLVLGDCTTGQQRHSPEIRALSLVRCDCTTATARKAEQEEEKEKEEKKEEKKEVAENKQNLNQGVRKKS